MPRKQKVDEDMDDKKSSKKKYDPYDIQGLPHVGPATFEKLEASGITTVFDVVIRGSRELLDLAQIPSAYLDDIIQRSYDIVMKSGITRSRTMDMFALEQYKKLLPKIKIHSNNIDNLLKGGFERESLIELYGENGSGKTQTCFTLAIEAIEQFETDVIWIDVEDTLEPCRLLEIATSRGYAPNEEEAKKKFFPHIIHRTCPNTDIIMVEVNNLSKLMLERKPKLLILDGVTGQFRAEYLGRGTLSGRQQNLNRFLHILTNLAFFFSCCVVYTNQVQADPSLPSFMDPLKPIGGNIVGHASKVRLNMKKRGSKRVMKLEKSSKHAIEEVYFAITEKGIVDPE